MKFYYALSAVALLGFSEFASAQGFVNLDFEDVAFTGSSATISGWETYGYQGNQTSVLFNNFALDANVVSLQGTNSPILLYRAIQGDYSVLLQGGTISGGLAYNTNGASVFQTGQIPIASHSLLYSAIAGVQVTFNGVLLPSFALENESRYTVWGVDISSYAGQSGELRFTAPWQSTSLLDDIQFSSTPIPEPSAFILTAFGVATLLVWRPRKLTGQIRK